MLIKYLPYPLIFLSAVPSFSAQQYPNAVFLDCDTVSELSAPPAPSQKSPQKLHFKLDLYNLDVLELNTSTGIYESWCKDPEKNENIRNNGKCVFTADVIYVDLIKPITSVTTVEKFYFYRRTGKITGFREYYLDTTRDVSEIMKKQPMGRFTTDGMCQVGVDLSPTKRAF
jgi:hypothetical protein